MIFWKLPNNKFFAFIPRTGSTAWGQAILDTFYPELKKRQLHANTPNNKLAKPQFFIPHTKTPNGEIFGIIRDPIERFKSGFSRAVKNSNKQELLSSLNNRNLVNIHIRPIVQQVGKYIEKITWYDYDNQLDKLADDIGLPGLPPILNKSNEKPDLTDQDLLTLNQFYLQDINLYNQVKLQ